MQDKPLSRTEMKLLVYNKMKIKGMSYDEAYQEIAREIETLKESRKKGKQ